MKKFKVILALLLSLVFCLSAICCSSDNNGNNASLENGRVVIRLDKAGYGDAWIKNAIAGFEEEYKIKVDCVEVQGLTSKLKQSLDIKASNINANVDVADIYFAGFELSDFKKWTDYGKCVLEPLEDLQCVANLNEGIKKWGSRSIRGTEHLYAIHPNIALETFIYNQEMLNKISSNGEYVKGVWPTTWQGLLDLCEELVVNMNGKIEGRSVVPYAIYLNSDFEPQKLYETLFAQGNGGADYYKYFTFDMTNETPTQDDHDVFVNNSFVDAMWALDQFLQVEKNESKYFKNYPDDLDAIDGFLKGEALFCWQGSFFETEASEEIKDFNTMGDNYKIGVVPAISGNEKDRTINLNFPHETIIIPNFAENKENAKTFLDYIYRDENLINIVKTMNAIPAFTHNYTANEKATLTRWGKDVVAVYEQFSNESNYANGISFRKSDSRVYRGNALNSLNFNVEGQPLVFGYMYCVDSNYRKNSKQAYKDMLENQYTGLVNNMWSDWLISYPV